MTSFLIAVAFTIGVSALCSLMEAMILSTTVSEVEALKQRSPRQGQALERLKTDIGETISAILTMNTVANTLGATVVGGLAGRLFGDLWIGVVSGLLTLCILVFAEVIPKNLGVVYRPSLQGWLALPLIAMCRVLQPVTRLCNMAVSLFIRRHPDQGPSSREEILLLAGRGAREGSLGGAEGRMIANALSLRSVRVGEIMTPRSVVLMLNAADTVDAVLAEQPNLPFARMPVYQDTPEQVVGLVRRRDLLKAMATGREDETIGRWQQPIHYVPETLSAAAALDACLKHQQQLLLVVDEYGAVAGVVSLEDVLEHLLGREIFEKDDLVVDMRELARAQAARRKNLQEGGPREGPAGGA